MRSAIARCSIVFPVLLLFSAVPRSPAQAPDLAQQFQSPPAHFGPSCFWWWFGCPYSVGDIHENLAALKSAGLGGFRIYPIYSFPQATLPPGAVNAPYLSPRYLEMVREAVRYGRELGLQPESVLGTGWPFGGPYIPPEMGAGQLKFYSADVAGPQDLSGAVPGRMGDPEILLAVQAAEISADGGIDLSSSVDLTSRVRNWRLENWQVAAGRWKLMTFVGSYTGMKVKRAAPGGEGLVMDHFSHDAFSLHLKRNGDLQAPALKGADAVAMDSWEVFGANWTPALPQEFQKRRGYPLLPYLPAIFLPSGDIGRRIRYDFRLTLSELALENCFASLSDWAHKKGFKTRVEAHGTPADILEAYGVNDFPEAETYGPEDRRRINIRDRKLASSAGHLFGRNQISCESFTWLRFPLFLPTLENMKAAADAIYLDGINQVNYHGVPFSPSWAKSGGWYYYAETNITAANPWWPYLRNLSDYLRRANFLLQQGTPIVDLAVYLPYEDVWSEAYRDWFDLAGALESHFDEGGIRSIREMLETIQSEGYSFDFINARRLKESVAEGALLRVGSMHYRAVILPAISAIDPGVLEHLRDFNRSGGLVVAVNRLPERSPGFLRANQDSALVRQLTREIFGETQNRSAGSEPGMQTTTAAPSGRVNAVLVQPDPYQALAPGTHPISHFLDRVVGPDLVIDPPDRQVGFVHRAAGNRQIYFLANVDAQEKHLRGSFRVTGLYPWLFDAESGRVAPLHRYTTGSDFTEVDLKLGPWGSAFVVFTPDPVVPAMGTNLDQILHLNEKTGEVQGTSAINGTFELQSAKGLFKGSVQGLPASLAITGPWQFRTVSGIGRILETLGSWTEFPELESFSGSASYRCELMIPGSFAASGRVMILDLGEVRDVAEVTMNGRKAGVAWKHPFSLDVTGYVKPGPNELEIKVANRLINQMRLQPALPPPYLDLKERVSKPVPSGLLGPVQLRSIQMVTLKPVRE